jgi:hypothetical protein
MYRQNTSIMIRLKWREMKMDPERVEKVALENGDMM